MRRARGGEMVDKPCLLRRFRVGMPRTVGDLRFLDNAWPDLPLHLMRRCAFHLAPEAAISASAADVQAGRDFFPIESATMAAQHGADPNKNSATVLLERRATDLLRQQ